jgi:hypothetical protein
MALEKRISELTAKSGSIEDTDLMVISDYNGATYDTKKVTGAQVRPFKTILLTVSQLGTSAPTLDWSYTSEITQTLTLSRVTTGSYKITASSALFTTAKTFVLISSGNNTITVNLNIYTNSSTEIFFYSANSTTGSATDGLLDYANIEIKIIK